MIKIRFENNNTLIVSKPTWVEAEVQVIEALDFVLNENGRDVTIDLRITFPQALSAFFQNVIKSFLVADRYKSNREMIFPKIAKFFKDKEAHFQKHYMPIIDYSKNTDRALFKYQQAILNDVMYKKHNLLALQMGVGKTIIAASMSKMMNYDRTLIVCPSLLKWNWFYDLTRDWGYSELGFTIYDAKKSKCMTSFGERFVIVNYESVKKYTPELLSSNFQHIIADEAHYIKNEKSQRSRAFANIVKQNPNAKVTLLTGTPISNRVDDLFGYLKISSHSLGNSRDKFRAKFALTTGSRGRTKVTGAKNIPELRLKLSNYMIRKRSDECLELPPLILQRCYFDIEASEEYQEKEKEIYELAEESEKHEGFKAVKGAPLQLTTNLHTLNRLNSLAKIDSTIKFIDSILDMDEKIVVFTWYTDVYEKLGEHYGDASVIISGKIGASEKQARIDRFKTDPTCKVFIAQNVAGGIGITLTNSKYAFFCDIPFTPDWIEQCYKRIHRIGQKHKCNVFFSIANETVDEYLYELIVSKTEDINEIVDKDKPGVVSYNNISQELMKRIVNKHKNK